MNDLGDLWGMLIPFAVGAVGVVVGFFWGRIKAYAKSTEATWDDKLVAAIEEATARAVIAAEIEAKKADKEKPDA